MWDRTHRLGIELVAELSGVLAAACLAELVEASRWVSGPDQKVVSG